MKKPLFEASFRVTKESCRALAKAKSSQYFRTVWVCNALIALGVTILWVIGSFHARWLTEVLALLVLHSALGVRLAAWWMYASRNASVDVTRLSFLNEGVYVRSRVEESLIRYDHVTGLRRDGEYLMIYMRHHTPLVICDGEVADGKAAELEAFLSERTGQTVRFFRT